jgi:hypothetical protein
VMVSCRDSQDIFLSASMKKIMIINPNTDTMMKTI